MLIYVSVALRLAGQSLTGLDLVLTYTVGPGMLHNSFILSSMINGLPRAFSSHSINKSAAEVSENTQCLLRSRLGAGTLFLLMLHGQNKPSYWVHLTRSEMEEIYSAFSGKDYNITGQRGIQGGMDSDNVNTLYLDETNG